MKHTFYKVMGIMCICFASASAQADETILMPGSACNAVNGDDTSFEKGSSSLTIGAIGPIQVICPIERKEATRIYSESLNVFVVHPLGDPNVQTSCTLVRRVLTAAAQSRNNYAASGIGEGLKTLSFPSWGASGNDLDNTVYALKCSLPANSTLRGYRWNVGSGV